MIVGGLAGFQNYYQKAKIGKSTRTDFSIEIEEEQKARR